MTLEALTLTGVGLWLMAVIAWARTRRRERVRGH